MGEDQELAGTGATAVAGRRPPRTRPLVAPSAVRTWARDEGLQVGSDFEEVSAELVDRYLEHLGMVVQVEPEEAADEGGGRVNPDPCPRCGSPGYLEHIDMRRRTQTQRCRPCGNWWETELTGLDDPLDEPSWSFSA